MKKTETETKAKKKKSLRMLFEEDGTLLEQAFHAMGAAINSYVVENYEKAKEYAQKTIDIEKEQDSLREVMIDRLFSKETMVFSRSDRLIIIEQCDKIVDECEIVVRKLLQFMPDVPKEMEPGMKIIGDNNHKIGTELKQLLGHIFDDFSKTKDDITKINDYRREIRETHWKLLELNFKLNHPSFLEFSYYRDLIKAMARVADLAEEFADQLYGFVCKYSL
ncbi:MAG: DUF47 domain-containing protein [Promethearchaeota archaeon]